MKHLTELAEQIRANNAALASVTELYDYLRTDFLSNGDCPHYLNECVLGGLSRAIHVVAEQTDVLSDSLADKLAESEGANG